MRARRPVGRRVADRGQRLLAPLRRGYYCETRFGGVTRLVPRSARRKVGLDDPSAVGSRRIEIGCGPYPQPGYIHVEVDPGARHIEAYSPGWDLPFPDGWAEEILAVHSLEHVHPRLLLPTLREWHRVLAPGGRARVHVPDSPELMRNFIESPVEGKWRMIGALLGMYSGPEVRRAEELGVSSDHQILFDAELLSWAFKAAGFERVLDLSDQVRDRHDESWSEVVPRFSLIAEAVKAPA